MNYKMIVTDLDATLLHKDKSVSDYTLQVLRTCQEKGLKIAIASARMWISVKDIAEKIHSDGVVTVNGAMTKVGDWEVYEPLNREILKLFVEKVKREIHNPKITMFVDDSKAYANWDFSVPWVSEVTYHDFSEIPEGNVTKMMVVRKAPGVDETLARIVPDGIYLSRCGKRQCQMMDVRATKWQGVCKLAEHWGISSEEIICFGDDFDDINMIENCGHGVAMANAIPEVLAVAKNVTEFSNDEDGVARYLEKLLKNA